MTDLVLKFNAHPASTLAQVVGLANSLGVSIASIEDSPKTKSISHKIVVIQGSGKLLEEMRARLARVPAVSIKRTKNSYESSRIKAAASS